MAQITKAKAYANGSVALIAWDVDGKIPGCLGFELTRVYQDPNDGQPRVLAAWVPFEGQSNPDWIPQTTSIWPCQRLMWRDLTLIQKRDRLALNKQGVTVKYQIRPVGQVGNGQVVPQPQNPTFTGPAVPLRYLADATDTDFIKVTGSFGDISCAFTNGILSTQFLVHLFAKNNKPLNATTLKAEMKDLTSPVRSYLAGASLPFLKGFFDPGADEFYQALYELEDEELIYLIKGLKAKDHLILSNTSKDKAGTWDVENQPERGPISAAGVDLTDRMFNNDHIGHNKFSIRIEAGQPAAVLTGSTNWTTTGMCAQSNNAVVVESQELAQQYLDYWHRLKDDTALFSVPSSVGAGTTNKQGAKLRAADMSQPKAVTLGDGTEVQAWFSPNTMAATKSSTSATPPDLADVFSRMRKAEKLILFAVFLPSQGAKGDVVRQAIDLGLADPSLMVYGCLSDATAMPNFVPKARGTDEDERTPEQKQPHTFDSGNVHLVRATAIDSHGLIGNFEAEMLKSSNMAHAIIHDKIIVVDPLSDDGFVVTGSHNQGMKASYENDENMLIISKNPGLVQAYAVHVMDLWDHYRFRALQAVRAESNQPGQAPFDGFLSTSDGWMDDWLAADRRKLADYFS